MLRFNDRLTYSRRKKENYSFQACIFQINLWTVNAACIVSNTEISGDHSFHQVLYFHRDILMAFTQYRDMKTLNPHCQPYWPCSRSATLFCVGALNLTLPKIYSLKVRCILITTLVEIFLTPLRDARLRVIISQEDWSMTMFARL